MTPLRHAPHSGRRPRNDARASRSFFESSQSRATTLHIFTIRRQSIELADADDEGSERFGDYDKALVQCAIKAWQSEHKPNGSFHSCCNLAFCSFALDLSYNRQHTILHKLLNSSGSF